MSSFGTAASRQRSCVVVAICTLLWGCEPSEKAPETQALTVSRASEAVEGDTPPSILFTDVTAGAGIDFIHYSNATGELWMPEIFVGGIAFVDFDRDTLPDIFAVAGTRNEETISERSSLVVYRNLGNGRFEDVTERLGLHTTQLGFGITVADFDGDDWPDLFVSMHGHNRIFFNMEGQSFEDRSESLGAMGSEQAMSIVTNASDIDNDGDLDLLVGNYVDWSKDRDVRIDDRFDGISRGYSGPRLFDGTSAQLLVNNLPDAFVDVTADSGIGETASGALLGKVLGIVAVYLDEDPFVDFLLANDTIRNFTFRNRGDGTFEENAEASGFAYNNLGQATASMGIDNASLGRQLDQHVVIGNFSGEMSSVYRYDEPGVFTDISPLTGIGVASRKALTFGVLFSDLDLDGRQDLVQANGHVQPDIQKLMLSQSFSQLPQVFWNCGDDCPRNFQVLENSAIGDLGVPVVGRGLAAADYDGDGDLDLLLSEVDGPLRLLRNDQASNNNWLRIQLQDHTQNTAAIGAVVDVVAGGRRQRKQIKSTQSYVSQSESILTFGLGKADRVDEITVRWPGGGIQTISDGPVNQLLRIVRED